MPSENVVRIILVTLGGRISFSLGFPPELRVRS